MACNWRSRISLNVTGAFLYDRISSCISHGYSLRPVPAISLAQVIPSFLRHWLHSYGCSCHLPSRLSVTDDFCGSRNEIVFPYECSPHIQTTPPLFSPSIRPMCTHPGMTPQDLLLCQCFSVRPRALARCYEVELLHFALFILPLHLQSVTFDYIMED